MIRKLLAATTGLAAAFGMAAAAQADTITITADEWCPYNCTPGSDKPGYVVELAQKIYGDAGHEVKYKTMPWQRALKAGARGQVNGVIAVSFQPETEKMVLPEEPIVQYQIKAVTAKDSDWEYTGPDSLGDRRVAVLDGYNYGDAFMKWMENNQDQIVTNRGDAALERSLEMVKSGRVAMTLDGQYVLRHTINQAGLSDSVEFSGTVGDSVPLYLGFSKKAGNAEEYAKLWTEGIQRMRENGTLQPILDKYQVDDWAK